MLELAVLIMEMMHLLMGLTREPLVQHAPSNQERASRMIAII